MVLAMAPLLADAEASRGPTRRPEAKYDDGKCERHARAGEDFLAPQSLPVYDHETTLEPASSNVVVQDISTSMAGLAPITPVLVPGKCKVSRRSYTMNALPPASYERVGRPQSRTSSVSGAPLQELRTSLYGVVVAQDARTMAQAATRQRFNADTSRFD